MNWDDVTKYLREKSQSAPDSLLSSGQRNVVAWLADRISAHGVLVADEVGLGKTRIACALLDAVTRAGGRVAVIAPSRLLYQWQGEWREYVKESGCQAAAEPHMLRSRWSLFDQSLRFPVANPDRWLLLSSRFAGFNIRSDEDAFIALLTLAADKIREKTGKTVTWGAGKAAAAYAFHSWENYHRAAEYLAAKADRRKLLMSGLGDDRLLVGLDGVRAKLAVNTPGRELLHKTLGLLLGEVDLVIIDEAHKSREYDSEVNATALGRLLNEIILSSSDVRRVALTATPVELDVSQWKSTLERINVVGVDLQPASTFRDAVQELRKYPTDPDAARKLVEEAAAFSKSLSLYVVRRLRVDDLKFRELMPAALMQSELAHPHRSRVEIRKIIVDALDPPWKRNVFAFEFLGKAAKGLPDASVEKLIDRRFASGHIDDDLLNSLCAQEITETDPLIARKKQRLRYWAQRFAGRNVQDHGAWLASHPRIREAIRRIEYWNDHTGPDGQKEKVLVFGTYTAPLRVLRDCLNARRLLRQVGHPLPARRGVLSVGFIHEELKRMIQDGTAPTSLCDLDGAALDTRLNKASREWENLRKNLAMTISDDWLRVELEVAEGRVDDVSTVTEYLRELIIFDALAQGRNPAISPEERKRRAGAILADLQEAVLKADGEGQEGDVEEMPGSVLERIALHIRSEQSSDDDTGTHTSHSSSTPAVYLGGGVSAISQRMIQARFNAEDANPSVLICQSTVGREGLNLHKACRVVLLFHPEWNPAVVEQQIGRVDRIRSRWEKLAGAWRANNGALDDFPRVVIEALCFSGTYDEYQTEQLNVRMAELKAQLFGEFVTDLEVSDEVRGILQGGGIDFSPVPLDLDYGTVQ